ncbi:MAG: hypothetical protein PHW93_03675 [Candidatus Methanomethylophilaceae archaeon]|nr:hypothetical protein [Candidatus Methanomethylophilaceae archaeon]
MFRIINKKKPRRNQSYCEGVRNGRILIVRCEGCIYESDLEDESCIKNLSRVLMDQSDVDRLILRRGIDKEYHGDALEALKELSKLSSACVGLVASPGSTKKCKDCPVNPELLFGAIWRTMPDPVTETARNLLSRVDHFDERCHRCVRTSLENLDRIDYIHQSTASRIHRLAYHVLEV